MEQWDEDNQDEQVLLGVEPGQTAFLTDPDPYMQTDYSW
jgi:hypothetical protein